MLTTFLKSREEERVICCISKFVDRIQIPSKRADIEVLRYFCISVHPQSSPLHEISILTPHKREKITNLENRSDQLLNREDPFNKCTTIHRVGNMQERILTNWDRIPRVRVLRAPQLELESLGDRFSLIKIFFNEELRPGEHGALRFKFTIEDCLHVSSRYKREKNFWYFLRPTDGELPGYSPEREVKCLPWFGHIEDPQARRVPGGFDVFVRHPGDIIVKSRPESSIVPTSSEWNLDGTQSTDEEILGWRLRYLLKNVLPGNPPEIGVGSDIRIHSVFERFFTIRDAWIMFVYTVLVALGISLGVALLIQFLWP